MSQTSWPFTDAEVLHLGCNDVSLPDAINVDINPDSSADVIADVTEMPWDWAVDNEFSRVEAHHLIEHLDDRESFFREVARVLRPGGRFILSVPLGANAYIDDDHKTRWSWETPEQFCVDKQRPWDPSVPFRLLDRDLTVYLAGPLGPLNGLFQLAAKRWPEWAAHRCFTGELQVSYIRIGER